MNERSLFNIPNILHEVPVFFSSFKILKNNFNNSEKEKKKNNNEEGNRLDQDCPYQRYLLLSLVSI